MISVASLLISPKIVLSQVRVGVRVNFKMRIKVKVSIKKYFLSCDKKQVVGGTEIPSTFYTVTYLVQIKVDT